MGTINRNVLTLTSLGSNNLATIQIHADQSVNDNVGAASRVSDSFTITLE